jgi:hypothetical protein
MIPSEFKQALIGRLDSDLSPSIEALNEYINTLTIPVPSKIHLMKSIIYTIERTKVLTLELSEELIAEMEAEAIRTLRRYNQL